MAVLEQVRHAGAIHMIAQCIFHQTPPLIRCIQRMARTVLGALVAGESFRAAWNRELFRAIAKL